MQAERQQFSRAGSLFRDGVALSGVQPDDAEQDG